MTSGTSVDPREYWETRLARHYTADGVGYLGLGVPFNKWMYRVRRRVFLDEVRRALPDTSGIEVLDIGSGTGFYVDMWHELGVPRLTGSDLTDVAVENLRRRYPMDQFVQLDIGGRFTLSDQQITAISMMDVLYHIVDDEHYRKAVANIFQALRPGGLFIFTENFVRDNAVRIPHQASRTLSDIEHTLIQTGFEIVRRRPVFFLMNAPIDSKSRLHRRWWSTLRRAVHKRQAIGEIVGAALYPIELALVSRLLEGPSTELMVCRRPHDRSSAS